MGEGEGKIFVEEIFEKFAHPDVGPAAVDEQKAFKEAELSDGEVRGHDSLKTFLTGNSHSDVRGPGIRRQRERNTKSPCRRHSDTGKPFIVTYYMTITNNLINYDKLHDQNKYRDIRDILQDHNKDCQRIWYFQQIVYDNNI